MNASRYHSFDFLVNAYLQVGQDKRAKAIVDARNRIAEFPSDYRLTGHTAFAAIPVRYAFERGEWAEAARLRVSATPFPQAEAITWFGRALGGARSGDLASAKDAIGRIEVLEEKLAHANDVYWQRQVDMQRRAATAWIALAEGRKEQAIVTMGDVAESEENSKKNIAMENRLSPMRELFGELLLQAQEPAKALEAFQGSLRSAPNRYRSFVGAATAAAQSGQKSLAREYFERIVALGGHADTERPGLVMAREALSEPQ